MGVGTQAAQTLANHAERPEKISGLYFKMWQQIPAQTSTPMGVVLNQVQEFQIILREIHSEGMTLSETFQVAAMIEKFPPSWLDFKNCLKHKRKEMIVEDRVVCLQIEKDNRLALKITKQQFSPKANMVEHGQSFHGYKKKIENCKGKGKGKVVDLGMKKGGVKKHVFPI
ncbi:hypothetical protein R6Q59_024836 [Mikania micrantha]